MRDDQVSRCDKCLYYFRAVTTFVFSHIGLFSLVVGYIIMGAFAFKELEADLETEKKKEMKKYLNELIDDLWKVTREEKVLDETNWTLMANKTLEKFESELVTAVRKMGYAGADEIQWTFSGALLYSIIVITTIGYGNVAPKTAWGKVVTILYAVVGIPLMLLCMSNIGDTMAQSFKFVYWKVCCCLCTRTEKSRRVTRSVRYHRYPSTRSRPGSSHHSSTRSGTQVDDELSGAGSYYVDGNDDVLGKYVVEEEPVDSYGHHHRRRLRVNPQPLPTVHIRPKSCDSGGTPNSPDVRQVPIILNKYVLESKEDLRVDLPPTPHKDGYLNHLQMQPPAGSRSLRQTPPQPPRRLASMEPMHRHGSRRKQYRHHDEAEYGGGGDSEDEMEEEHSEHDPEKEHITVPIWLCCALVTGYICGGAVLFSVWEKWNFLDASYFCFVTLTTIGFGDLVPGKSVIHDDSQTTLALCALYLLFGMALLAMSFNLVQEQVTTTVKSIGKRIGIVEDNEDDDDDTDDDE